VATIDFPTLANLIKGAIAGDEAAQRDLMSLFADELLRFIIHFLSTHGCANAQVDSLEVANWTWFKATDPKTLENLKDPGKFRSWLYTVAKHCAIAHLRTCVRHRPPDIEDLYPSGIPDGALVTTDEQLKQDELVEEILEIAKGLDSNLHWILTLQLSDTPDVKIAEFLTISRENVRTIRRRGLIQIRAILRERENRRKNEAG